MKRDKYQTRQAFLGNEMNREAIISLIRNAPVDPVRPLEVLIREQVKKRGLDQNSAFWAGPMKDIAEQAWVGGRRYSAEVWAEYFKKEYLPEEFDPELCLEGYRKWDIGLDGERILVGSTTKLSKKGFAIYREQVTAYGASLGVMFREYSR